MLTKILLLFISLFVSGFLSVPALSQERQLSLHIVEKKEEAWVLRLHVPYMTNYGVFLLEKPQRLVIDILDPKLKPIGCRIKMVAIKRCRMGRLDGRRARFVLDLKRKIHLENAQLTRDKRKHYLEVRFSMKNAKQAAETEFVQAIKPIEPKGKKNGKFIIVIDAGHGGARDTGSSYGGMDEKDITLKYAKELRAALVKEKNIEVRMTRTKDDTMLLKKRLMLVRERHADMLISLHADWNADPKVKGIAVYSQSKYASDKYMQRFLQNERPQIIQGGDWKKAMPSAYGILFDITQRDTLNKSIVLSRALLEEMRLYSPVLDQPHRFADFHLLSAPDLPAVLIEMGFLSNRGDRKKLTSKKWRRGLSRRIVRAVKTYRIRLQQVEKVNYQKKNGKKSDKTQKQAYNSLNPKQ